MFNFLWIGLNFQKAVEPIEGNSLLLTTKLSGHLDTPLIKLGRMKEWTFLSLVTL